MRVRGVERRLSTFAEEGAHEKMAGAEVALKLVVEEPEKSPYVLNFEQKMIKIGRGARKGVDVQLEDKKVSRVHAVIQIRNETDISVMPMGAGTFLDGKKVAARGKLTSGSVLEVGETKLTVRLGADILQPEDFELAAMGGPTASTNPDAAASQEFSESGYEIEDAQSVSAMDGLHTEQSLPSLNDGTNPDLQAAPASTHGAAPNATTSDAANFGRGVPAVPDAQALASLLPATVTGYQAFPSHQEQGHTYGFYGPTPAPLPEQWSGASPAMLNEVMDRLSKEVWFEQSS